jgi:arsenate reductase
MKTTIWHNPRCSKSRQTLALLMDEDLELTVRNYLDDTPSVAELGAALDLLGIEAAAWLRTREDAFKAAGLKGVTDRDTILAAMHAHPKLIERPVVITASAAAIGRPPESVLGLFR